MCWIRRDCLQVFVDRIVWDSLFHVSLPDELTFESFLRDMYVRTVQAICYVWYINIELLPWLHYGKRNGVIRQNLNLHGSKIQQYLPCSVM